MSEKHGDHVIGGYLHRTAPPATGVENILTPPPTDPTTPLTEEHMFGHHPDDRDPWDALALDVGALDDSGEFKALVDFWRKRGQEARAAAEAEVARLRRSATILASGLDIVVPYLREHDDGLSGDWMTVISVAESCLGVAQEAAALAPAPREGGR